MGEPKPSFSGFRDFWTCPWAPKPTLRFCPGSPNTPWWHVLCSFSAAAFKKTTWTQSHWHCHCQLLKKTWNSKVRQLPTKHFRRKCQQVFDGRGDWFMVLRSSSSIVWSAATRLALIDVRQVFGLAVDFVWPDLLRNWRRSWMALPWGKDFRYTKFTICFPQETNGVTLTKHTVPILGLLNDFCPHAWSFAI